MVKMLKLTTLGSKRGKKWKLESEHYNKVIQSGRPGELLGEEGNEAEEEEHEEHARVLEVVHMGRVEDAFDEELEVGGVEQLDAHVDEGSDGDQVELQVLEATSKARDRAPRPHSEGVRAGHVADDGGPDVPHPHHQEQGPRQRMPLERPHLCRSLERSSVSFGQAELNLKWQQS